MNWHIEVLPAQQRQVLHQLGPVAHGLGFYLAGGTAVALYLGHRESLDLDWFTGEMSDEPVELALDVRDRGVDLQIASAHRRTLHGLTRGVGVRFLESRYPPLRPPVKCSEFGCTIAALQDLAAFKLLAITQRGIKKDFLDVYALGMSGLSLPEMLACYRQKFSVRDTGRVVFALCYFDDADQAPMPKMLDDTTWEEVKSSLRQWVKSIAG
jgi:hypothetical protein